MKHRLMKIVVGAFTCVMMGVSLFQTAAQEDVAAATKRYAKKSAVVQEIKIPLSVKVDKEAILRNDIVDYALQFVGNPYVYGGTSLTNGTDCSGFTMGVYKKFSISLSRTSRSQAYDGKSIKRSELQKGDLVFYGSGSYISHVAMYIGNGKIVHASNPSSGIKVSPMNYRTPCRYVSILS
ncbi:MAG: C40 family peptidase [Firmicutes bacterium]|uniref:C40 family peptidase n=1 Tax=Candidatus Scybalomonas excrementavium TaxID=2840943 RepID=A0A9D9I0W7_9FIRM|nr:C40 family peptidase [Candidatus Scybalomonas excrementavium]